MRVKIKSLLSGWEIGDKDQYAEAYHIYGGSTATHPDILQFFHDKAKCNPTYFIKRNSSDELIGACCAWGHRYLAGDTKARTNLCLEQYPLTCGEIALPLSSSLKHLVPFRTKYLSDLNNNVINATYKLNSHRQIQLAKGCGQHGFRSKTKTKRNRELRDFIAMGGEVKDQSEFSADELTALYGELFLRRRKCELGNVDHVMSVISELRNHVFGHVLLMHGEPCAFQLVTQSESPAWVCFDFINSTFDPRLEKYSIGSIVTWLNVKAAYELCQSKNKLMRYSFGNPTAEYKKQWCYLSPVGRLLFP